MKRSNEVKWRVTSEDIYSCTKLMVNDMIGGYRRIKIRMLWGNVVSGSYCRIVEKTEKTVKAYSSKR